MVSELFIPDATRLIGEGEADLAALHHVIVGDVGLAELTAVDSDALDVALLLAQLGSREAERTAVGQADRTLSEEGRDEFVASAQGIDGVEAERGEDVPADI